MSLTEFTDEQMMAMAANPYTYRVTRRQVAFTKEFKERFWAMYCQGIRAWSIMEILGYNPEDFGQVRVSGIQKHIRDEFGKEKGFHSGRALRNPADESSKESRASARPRTSRPKSTQDLIKDMQHEIKYMRQEVEFLKKISLAKTTKK